MTKPERKSITDLIASKTSARTRSVEDIDKITDKIHQPEAERIAPKGSKSVPVIAEGRIKRISVNAPVSLYLKAKTKATIQEESLMAYIIRLIEEDTQD